MYGMATPAIVILGAGAAIVCIVTAAGIIIDIMLLGARVFG